MVAVFDYSKEYGSTDLGCNTNGVLKVLGLRVSHHDRFRAVEDPSSGNKSAVQ